MAVALGCAVLVGAVAGAAAACSGAGSEAGGGTSRETRAGAVGDSTAEETADAAAYQGSDPRGIPRYATVAVSADDSLVLRRAYGIEDPHRLYVSDSTEEGLLKYDTWRKSCRTCYVNSYRVGYVSVRRPEESWDEAERRVRATSPRQFGSRRYVVDRSTADLDPDVRPIAEQMLRTARRAGFRIRVRATYRSPLREAFLMAEGRGRTHTLTSNHSYGRALDIVVDDGNLSHSGTKRDWIAFRRWVTRYATPTNESFRVLGKANRTWDWPHVELPSADIGFHSIAEAVSRGRACLAPDARIPCNFPPHLRYPLRHAVGQSGRPK